MSDYPSLVSHAVQLVLFDFDLPDRAVPEAVQAQACQLALLAFLLHPSLPTALLIVTGISLFLLLTH